MTAKRSTEKLEPKRTLEQIIDCLEAFAPEATLYISSRAKRIAMDTVCQPFSPGKSPAKDIDGLAAKHGLVRLMTVDQLEEILIDISLKKTHFRTPDLIKALNYFRCHRSYMPIKQPY
jgi:hypothetical protein